MTQHTRLSLFKLPALTALVIGMGSPVMSENLTAWNNQRAELFASVCVGSAPSFAAFADTARRAGFKDNGPTLLLESEIEVSLGDDGAGCSCKMTFGAPVQRAMIETVLNTVFRQYPDSLVGKDGFVQTIEMMRDGQVVVIDLQMPNVDAKTWVFATATTQTACPK
jgi:hypothetical protein